ncbi:hypothetical protein H0H93_013353 [Arthromyces matolae]|nr:hypothetical protein H0H93_013353 [Arthromyces matolae]
MRTKSQDNDEVQESRFGPPHFVIVNGLNIDQKEYLVKEHVFIIDKDTSFLIFPMEVKRDLFVGTIAGLHYVEADEDTVLDLVKETLMDHRELKATMAAGLPNYTPAIFRQLINNLRVSFINIGEEGKWNHIRGWNVILPRHNMDTRTTGIFTTIMRHTTFTVLGFGTGTFMQLNDIPLCDGCKSLGHDWQNCPFPAITGWRGPPPAEKKKKTNVPHDEHDWFNSRDNSAGPSTHRPPSNNNIQRGRNTSGRGGSHRGRGNMRRNGRGGRRY